MIRSFNYYLNKGVVRKVKINLAIVESLLKKSTYRLDILKESKITYKFSSIIFEEVYESIREAVQSLMQLKGYKPYSHEVIISFLKENKSFSPQIINTINRYRILRNKSVYEAKDVSIKTCKDALKFAIKFIRNIKHFIKK